MRMKMKCIKCLTQKQPKLSRFAVPSLNLPKRRYTKQQVDTHRKMRFQKRHELKRDAKEPYTVAVAETRFCEIVGDSADSQKPRSYEQLTTDEKVAVQALYSLYNSEVSLQYDKAVQVSSDDIFVSFTNSIKENTHLNSLTGIPTFEQLDGLVSLVCEFYPDKKVHKLTIKDRIILVFMKLKMALKFNVLSFLFKLSPTYTKMIFSEYVGYLSSILKEHIYWPSYEECQQNMPIYFNNFRSVRVILDCFEIPLEKPKCLCCRIRTYSHYKGRQTIKIMTGVSPAGIITFLPKAYGGRSSDKVIFEQSKLIRKLQPKRDYVMVDKGFLIDDICSKNFVKIIRPYFLRSKKQFSEAESRMNVSISKARVHIERVNQRIKVFDVLNTPLPITLVPDIDNIMIVICAMVNLENPVLGMDKFSIS
ncbi:unnamed protein product [Callosobruchus maculatus]|uniref:DDE Tnp4 domain-containing protein n=1 Tax=Callosobruchus maculatus TaxID=64391 RepID=A0A653DGR5_CALMS|nr:unnamed protein product [Callosobruchus maculatus]